MSNATLTMEHGPVSPPEFQAAQFMPTLMEDREIARIEANAILAANRQLLRDGEFDAVPIPVDPLSTADLVIEARERYREGSPQHKAAEQALELDCHRLLLEAVRAKTWEYFSKSKQEYDRSTGYYYSHGYAIATIVENGLSPVSEAEEADRRLNEAVEEIGTYMSIGRNLVNRVVDVERVPEIVNVATISPCTDWALERYKEGKSNGFGGYVPSKDRLMIRNVRFDSGIGYREEDQIGVSGEYIDQEVISEALRILDSRLPVDMGRTDIHGTQMVTNAEIGVWDYVELLDILASMKHGVTVWMGELVPEGETRNYETAKYEAVRRQAETIVAAQSLADDVLALAESGVDHWAANAFVEESVKKVMLSICEQDPDKAQEMFDAATVQGLKDVKHLESIGLRDEAQALRAEVERNAPRPEFCGAGSCGLESIDVTTERGKELLKKVQAEEGDTILRDVERKCGCGKKGGIIYAFTDKKVNKYCEHCQQFEHKMTKDGK